MSRAVAPHALHYAPDPSSQAACTIGGNVAENAGGPHCLKYGVTTNHILAITALLPSGEIVSLGSAAGETDGYDLVGAFVGSEGCFGIALDITVRLTRNPEAVRTMLADFMSIDAAARAVTSIVATGIIPAALEMIDQATIRAVEASIYAAGYPTDAAAVLLIEVDGAIAGLERDVDTHRIDLQAERRAHRARRARRGRARAPLAGTQEGVRRDGTHLVASRRAGRRRSAHEAAGGARAGAAHRRRSSGCACANVFHAGDGNLHPNIAYDANDPDESARVHVAMNAIMRACVDAGGTITGEHGVGIDKLPYMDMIFSPDSLAAMCSLRDVFDPDRRSNPGKVVPMHSCREWHGIRSTRSGASRNERRVTTAVSESTEAIGETRARRRPARRARCASSARERGSTRGRPVDSSEQLSLAAETGIVEYTPGDLTLTARAGTTLREIHDAVAPHGQWLALDPFGSDDGTIGATIATASAGPLATRFGAPRDLTLGLEFISGRGATVRGGGRVVKNVAGFDLTRLLTGSWGTLGVITEVTVRLHARPEAEITLGVRATASSDDIARVRAALKRWPFVPFACEVVSESLGRQIGVGGAAALFRLGGNGEAVAAQKRAVAELGDAREVEPDVWRALRGAERDASIVLRLSRAPADVAATWSDSLTLAEAPGAWTSASPVRGIARCVIPSAGAPMRQLASVLSGARSRVIAERAPEQLWSTPPLMRDADPLQSRIRDAFDPQRILNRGILGAGT